MIDALSTARSGLMAASSRLEATAARVASYGATAATASDSAAGTGAPVRIGYLPLPGTPDLAGELASMLEDEAVFKLNAAVFKTADRMLQSLYDAID